MRGLFIGRFQPFHNGHFAAIKHILGECGECIILIGSSQKCYDTENPLTVGERVEMINLVLEEEGLCGRCVVLSVPDIQNNALWVPHVRSLVPSFDIVYSNNPLVQFLFNEAGQKVKPIPFTAREKYDGTKIRGSLARNDSWRKQVPAVVSSFLVRKKIALRIRSVKGSDKV